MQQETQNEKLIVKTQDDSIKNTSEDYEKKEWSDTGKKGKRFNNIIGKKFGRLTPIFIFRNDNGLLCYKCHCDCGNIVEKIPRSSIISLNTRSCGCLETESKRNARKIHGMSKSSIYGIWCGMLKRCYNEKCEDYKYYGGRGIKVCDNEIKTITKWAKEYNIPRSRLMARLRAGWSLEDSLNSKKMINQFL